MNPIHLKLLPTAEKLPCGTSRFWGNPDLPKGVDYPMYTDEDGEDYPYCFVCQLNLEEVAECDPEGRLPHKGLLAFFAKIDHFLGYCTGCYDIGGTVSDPDAVKVFYFPETDNMREVVLVDDDDNELSPHELQVEFGAAADELDDHALFAPPTYRPWETWDPPFEDWQILLQVDSFEGDDFQLNFMDCGVLDFLIAPEKLEQHDFSDVRAIVLST